MKRRKRGPMFIQIYNDPVASQDFSFTKLVGGMAIALFLLMLCRLISLLR
jgi:hypothetical protein